MQIDLRFALWNANGITQHINELEAFIKHNQLDMVLVSETHFSSRSHFEINGFDVITCNRPDDAARGGSAIIIKSSILYEVLNSYSTIGIQATIIKIKCNNRSINFSAVYCRPRDQLKEADYLHLFNQMGSVFVAGGDYNAKHTWWGSRLITTKGRELYKCLQNKGYSVLSSGAPTYWPADQRKTPDLLDFFVTSRINSSYFNIQPSFDLSSDHSPVVAVLKSEIAVRSRLPRLNLHKFKVQVEEKINFNISLKNGDEIETAADSFVNIIYNAVTNSSIPETYNYTTHVSLALRNLIIRKRKLRRKYQETRHPTDKNAFNRACRELKIYLKEYKEGQISDHLSDLKPGECGEKSLWNATRNIKRPITRIPPLLDSSGNWLKTPQEKADAFADHFENTFQPFPSLIDDTEIIRVVNSPTQMDLPIPAFKCRDVKEEIRQLNNTKAPGKDGIPGKIMKSLPNNAIILITILYNAILRTGHFPSIWKNSIIIVIPKAGKPENELGSYRPISLLSVLSKIFERLFLRTLLNYTKLPDHQFGFRKGHGTTEQCHRVVHFIQKSLQMGHFCCAALLDIQQAFDRVWHPGLLYKLRNTVPSPIYLVLKSYLTDRKFSVRYNAEESTMRPIGSGVPQGSVLGPILYTMYTTDMTVDETAFTGTYADDTIFMFTHENLCDAKMGLQNQVQLFEEWAEKWRLRLNPLKSQVITFTLREEDTHLPIIINGLPMIEMTSVKYLGLTLDKKLLFREHIIAKKTHLTLLSQKFNWLIGRYSKLSLENKILIYKAIIRPAWSYCCVLWGMARDTNINKIQTSQSKFLRDATNAPWYVSNLTLHTDLNTDFVKDHINKSITNYKLRILNHSNSYITDLLDDNIPCRLRRRLPLDCLE